MLIAQSTLTISHHHPYYQVLKTASSVCTELMYVNLCWSTNTSVFMCKSPSENIAYELVPTFPAVVSMSCSSHLVALWDGRQVAVQMLFCGDPASRIYSKLHVAFLCSFHLVFFSMHFVRVQVVQSDSSIDMASGNEIFQQRYVNWSTNFKSLLLNMEMEPSCSKLNH